MDFMGFNLGHHRDINNSLVGGNAFEKHTTNTSNHMGIIVGTDPKGYTVDVVILGMRDNEGNGLVFRNIRVGTSYGGNGWGEHNLPWEGQQVEVKLENGINTSGYKATIGRRFYNNTHKPPQHPIFLDKKAYQKGHFEQAEGGSYSFKHADGRTTNFNSATNSSEGSKGAGRVTGVPKTATEGRLDKVNAHVKAGKLLTADIKAITTMLGDLSSKIEKLESLKKTFDLAKLKNQE